MTEASPRETLIYSHVDRVAARKAAGKARDEGRSRAYEAEERNAASGLSGGNPHGPGLDGRSAALRRLPME
jgi:hypothetical protein